MASDRTIDEEDDRPRRRNRTCVTTGLLIGAGLGVLAGGLVPSGVLFVLIGAVAGGCAGKLIAAHISLIDWDPSLNHRPYVGANSPDDDVAS